MNVRSIPLLFLALLPLALTGRAQTPDQAERINAAFALAWGRLPSPDEIKAEDSPERPSLAVLFARLGERLKNDPAAARAVAIRACADAFGRSPTDAELAAWVKDGATYTGLMKQHSAALAAQPDGLRAAIDGAYRQVINRAAYDVELGYWKSVGPLPAVLIVGIIENWAQRNAPGLTVTSGTPAVSVNSRFLTTCRLSPAVANEVRVLLGLPVWTDVARLKNPGCNVLAVGAAEIASVGGTHFLAFGLQP